NVTPDNFSAGKPSWSPDGTRIAISGAPDGQDIADVYTMSSDGTDLQRLTSHGGFNPAWSPDGNQIAFVRGTGAFYDISVMNADGSDPINLMNETVDEDFEPEWSPDGTQITFQRQTPTSNIWVMNADGSDLHQVTFLSEVGGPAWSPDGTRIAFPSLGGIFTM